MCVSMKAVLARNTPPISDVDPGQIFAIDALAAVFFARPSVPVSISTGILVPINLADPGKSLMLSKAG